MTFSQPYPDCGTFIANPHKPDNTRIQDTQKGLLVSRDVLTEDRTRLIESYLAGLEDEYHCTDNEDLWGTGTWETIRSDRIEALVESYEEQMNAASDEELFGDGGLESMVAQKIDQLIDAERERLDDMDDDELSEYLGSAVNTKNARTQANHVRTLEDTARINAMCQREKAGLTSQKTGK